MNATGKVHFTFGGNERKNQGHGFNLLLDNTNELTS